MSPIQVDKERENGEHSTWRVLSREDFPFTYMSVLRIQRKLFEIGSADLGDGQIIFEWSPKGTLVAVAGCKARTMV